MADLPIRQSALTGLVNPGHYGADGTGITIMERHPLTILQLHSWPDTKEYVAQQLKQFKGFTELPENGQYHRFDDLEIFCIGPYKWLLVTPVDKDMPSLALSPVHAAITDQSHAKSVIRISGADTRNLLSKGCGLDFHHKNFTPGMACNSLLGHFAVSIVAIEENCFDVYFTRSFAESAWEWLSSAALEFGFDVK